MFTHTRGSASVLLRGLPSLKGKNELFVGKKRKKAVSPTKSEYKLKKILNFDPVSKSWVTP